MTSDENTASKPNETTVQSANNTVRESTATAATKPELQPPLAKDGEEWEGFYENGDNEYDEF